MSRIWDNLSRLDTFILAAGLLAGFVYAVLMPRVSPDGAVQRSLPAEKIIEIGDVFIRARGGSTENLVADIDFVRETDILEAMQNGGRSRLRELLSASAFPGYSFDLKFRSIGSNKTDVRIDDRFLLKITPAGKIWQYTDVGREQDGPDGRSTEGEDRLTVVDRAALWAALNQDSTYASSLATILSWDDSTLVRRLRFNARSFFQRAGQARPELDAPPIIPGAPRAVLLNPNHAVTLAERYLRSATFSSSDFEIDSLWIERGNSAGIRFMSTDRTNAIMETVDVVVTSVGGLTDLRHTFKAVTPAMKSGLGATRQIIAVSIYFLLAVVLLVVFFRQLLIRALDVRAALIDSVIFSVSFVMFVLLAKGLNESGLPTWVRLLGLAAGLGVGGGVMALVVFLASAAADTLARRSWVRKLLNVSLVRQGSVLNSFVGSATVRGVSVGFIALAVSVIIAAALPNEPLRFSAETFAGSFVQPGVAAVGFAVWSAYFKTLLIILTIGSLIYKLGRPMLLVVVPIAIVFGLTYGAQIEFESDLFFWLSGITVGLVFAIAFWYFDVFVCFVALAVFSMMSTLQEGWLMDGSPFWLDVLFGGSLVAAMLVFGFVGIGRGRPSGSNLEYVPQYLKERSEQQRLQNELEIAREVQESFLPKSMPQYQNLDIAATCIPAQQVGGDYYDFVNIGPNRLGVALGDVSGKGIQAAFFMTLAKGFLRSSSRETDSPASVLGKVNTLFRESAPRGTFISLVYGILDTSESTFTFGRAGHNPIIVKKLSDASANLVRPAGLGIGLASGNKFAASMAEHTIQMEHGDLIVLFTDGFSEARNNAKEEYGDDRLARVVSANGLGTAVQIVDAVCADVVEFCCSESTHDDRTIMVIKFDRTHSHDA